MIYTGNENIYHFIKHLYMDILPLYKSTKTILTNKDLSLDLAENDVKNLNAKTAYIARRGVLIRLTRGFCKDKNYSLKELGLSLCAFIYQFLKP